MSDWSLHRAWKNPLDSAIAVVVMKMARSDKACSGVMFTIDPDSGHDGGTHWLFSWSWRISGQESSHQTPTPCGRKAEIGEVSHCIGRLAARSR